MPDYTSSTGIRCMRLLLLSILSLLLFSTALYAQEEAYLNIVTFEEPSWVYRARGDRLFQEGRYGDALAQYKKALIRRRQGAQYQRLNGIDIEKGLLRQNGRKDIYINKLHRFLKRHEETSEQVNKALGENRYDEARSIVQTLHSDAFDIGAEKLSDDAEALDRSIYLRKYAEWDYLRKRLFESDNGDENGSLSTVLRSLGEQFHENADNGDLNLNSVLEGNLPYPEVHLRIAQIYVKEGLYDIALQELDRAERGKDYFQIEDLIYTVMYTRAEIFRMQSKMADYQKNLKRIIEPERNDIWAGDSNFDIYKNVSLHKISDAAVKILSQDIEKRQKYGKAYFEYGMQKYENRNYLTAEPYLKMAFLYGYGYEDTNEYVIAKDMLKEYYISGERIKDAEKIDHINDMIIDVLKKSNEAKCISF